MQVGEVSTQHFKFRRFRQDSHAGHRQFRPRGALFAQEEPKGTSQNSPHSTVYKANDFLA